jgi:integrase
MKGSITRRGRQSWRIKYELPRDLETGERRTRYMTVKGAKRDAQIALAKQVAMVADGQHIDPSKLTLKDYLDRWLDDYAQHNVSAKTLERYREICTKNIGPAIGRHALRDLQPMHIQGYYSKALESGRRDGTGGLSERTVRAPPPPHPLPSSQASRGVASDCCQSGRERATPQGAPQRYPDPHR